MVSNHIIRSPHSPGVSNVLLLGKQELPVSNTAVTLPACNQVAVVCLFGILYIIDNGFDGGSNSPSLADVQRHQPCGCHRIHLPQKETACFKQTAVTLFHFFKFIFIELVHIVKLHFLMPAPKPHIVLLLSKRLDFWATILRSVFQPILLCFR